jgi:hypothetical protein
VTFPRSDSVAQCHVPGDSFLTSHDARVKKEWDEWVVGKRAAPSQHIAEPKHIHPGVINFKNKESHSTWKVRNST